MNFYTNPSASFEVARFRLCPLAPASGERVRERGRALKTLCLGHSAPFIENKGFNS